MQPLTGLEVEVDLLRQKNTRYKGQNRNGIADGAFPVQHGEVLPHQYDVARLRVGKDLAAAQIGVRILKAAGEGQQRTYQKGIGHLPVIISLHSFEASPSSKIMKDRRREAAPKEPPPA